ncbi:TPA: hypothetical protein OL450_002091 [Clostridioides difficile]|nr:hypothetical protein [Clostridioides difficile]
MKEPNNYTRKEERIKKTMIELELLLELNVEFFENLFKELEKEEEN